MQLSGESVVEAGSADDGVCGDGRAGVDADDALVDVAGRIDSC